MTAREIASHRYGRNYTSEVLSQDGRNADLISEFNNLVLEKQASGVLQRFVHLAQQFTQSSAAALLICTDDTGKELHLYDSSEGEVTNSRLGYQFFKSLGGRLSIAVDDVDSHAEHRDWRQGAPNVKAFAAVAIVIHDIRLGHLVVMDQRSRQWSEEALDQLKDVAQMLCADLELTRERHQIAIQKRMQRSLVQFVRGNMSKSGDTPAAPDHRYATKSLYSDLDEDLEIDDADHEADQTEVSKMNVMFDFSAKLIRRTLRVSGCVLVNIENLTDLENIEAEFPSRSTIMGACFLRHLRSTDWHMRNAPHGVSGTGSDFKSSAPSEDLDDSAVDRVDTFDPRGLDGSWLKRLLEDHPRAVSFDESCLPEAMVALLPAGLCRCLLSPIYDSNAKAFALIIVFSDRKGVFTKADRHYVEAFGSSIYAEVLNQSLQRANEAKSLFISKISHEFRTPLHGVLASAEFLNDMPETTPAQLGFVQTIDTCSRTLLDIINHVLDYSKLSLGNKVLDSEAAPETVAQEDFDLIEVAEQVLSAAFSSYEFKRINDHIDVQRSNSQVSRSDSDSGSLSDFLGRNLEVVVEVAHRSQGYVVNSDVGAYRRMLLNLLGNALKYTQEGHVVMKISLIPIEETPGLETLQIAITDTGVGIAKTFLIEMFRPFTQEDDFSAGTGLGLSIVKELCTKLHGTIDVRTTKNVGSTFTLRYPVIFRKAQETLFPGARFQRDLQDVAFHYLTGDSPSTEKQLRSTLLLQSSVTSQLRDWYGMREVPYEDAQILITDDNGYETCKADLRGFVGPILTLCSTTAKYELSRSRRLSVVQVMLTKPCGPLKLGEGIASCIAQASNLSRLDLSHDRMLPISQVSAESLNYVSAKDESSWSGRSMSPDSSVTSTVKKYDIKDSVTGGSRKSIREVQDAQSLAELYQLRRAKSSGSSKQVEAVSGKRKELKSVDTEVEPPRVVEAVEKVPMVTTDHATESMSGTSSPQTSADAKKKHILVVEDNPVNMMLLVAFAKQRRLAVTTAGNGRLAFERVRDRETNYDAILMDINMPVCNGYEATQLIREFEKQTGRDRSKIAALTGLSSQEDRDEATQRGADAFFTKPVKMKDLAQLLHDWGIQSAHIPADEKANVVRNDQ